MNRSIKFLTLTLSEGLNVLVGFLFLPYLSRAMEIADYGTYGQALMIVSLVAGVLAMGLGKVIFAFLANKKYEQGITLGSNLFAGFLCGLIGITVVLLVSSYISQQFDNLLLNELLKIYAFVLPFRMVATSLNAGLIFFDRVKQAGALVVFSNLIKVSLVVISVQVFDSLSYIFLSLIFVEILKCILGVMLLPKAVKSLSIHWNLVTEQMRVGWPLGIAAILGVAFYSTDGYMVSVMLDVEQYAIYKNGAFQIPFISSIYGAITAILLPDVSKLFFNKKYDDIVALKKKVISNTAMLIFPMIVFFIIFAKSLNTIYLSERYVASYPVFMIYNLVLFTRFTSYDDLFIATNNNHKMPLIYLAALSMNIILNYFFIGLWGPVGAALASVASFYVLVVLLFNKGTRLIDRCPNDFFEKKKLFMAFGLSVGMGVLFYFVSLFLMLNAMTIILLMAIYGLLTYHVFIHLKLMDNEIIRSFLQKGGNDNVILKSFEKIYG